jgi:hypothetical protein
MTLEEALAAAPLSYSRHVAAAEKGGIRYVAWRHQDGREGVTGYALYGRSPGHSEALGAVRRDALPREMDWQPVGRAEAPSLVSAAEAEP